MKTIIKYELVINKALRSALNYDTPDEQINEFIRFFVIMQNRCQFWIIIAILIPKRLQKI